MTLSEPDPRLSIILETCLEAIQSGQATFQECLERYPSEAPLLKKELHLALLATRLKSTVMSDEAVARLETRLRARFQQTMKSTSQLQVMRRAAPWQFAGKWAAAVLIVFLVALGAGGGTVAASSSSLPGDPLYGVKRAWESVIVFVASLVGRVDDVWLHLAQVRFEELIKLAEAGRLTSVQLDDFSASLETAIRLADAETTPRLVGFMMNAESHLQLVPLATQALPGYMRMKTLLKPHFDSTGRLQVRQVITTIQPMAPTPTAIPVAASATPTATATFTATPTLTATPTNTPIPPTETPRYPPTATRTPTTEPTATWTITPSPTPTLTWTALPLGSTLPTPTPVNPNQGPGLPQVSTPVTPVGSAPLFVRETQAAVYATQTAIARGTVEPTPASDGTNP